MDSFVVPVRFNFELIRFDNSVFIRKTRIGRIAGFAPSAERIFVIRVVRIFQPFEPVVYEHPGSRGRSIRVLVDQRYLEFRHKIRRTEYYRHPFVTRLTDASFFRVYAAVALGVLRNRRGGE